MTSESRFESEYLQLIEACHAQAEKETFPLTQQEQEALLKQGNNADCWDSVRKTSQTILDPSRIRNCTFRGSVVLGHFADSIELYGVKFPTGCYNSTLSDSFVFDDALVMDTFLVHRTIVDSRASLVRCGRVVCSPDATFANGMQIKIGLGSGGRAVACYADIPYQVAADVASKRFDKALLHTHEQFVNNFVKRLRANASRNVLCQFSRVVGCPKVEDCFIGPFALTEDSFLQNVSVLSTKDEPTSVHGAAQLHNAIVQWNCEVRDKSFVENVLLCDASSVIFHGKVVESIIGPNSLVAKGEIGKCLVGPFVGFNHQALLIASLWPEGKGNVSYGANVGSNHTLKAPDQELFPGEGVFYGLSCCIKYPCNFQKSPYSVIATGVCTLPQKLEMPFSLVNTPGHHVPSLSPAINEIFPGWVLNSSIYTILRNVTKYETRNKSKRTKIETEVFRQDIIDVMREARAHLIEAEGKTTITLADGTAIYTEHQVQGIGKNYMTEASRVTAIRGYTFYIRFFALNSLFKLIENGLLSNSFTVGQELSSRNPNIHAMANLLSEEYPHGTVASELLNELVTKFEQVRDEAEKCKARDDIRGQRIIPDYNEVHIPAAEEEAVIMAGEQAVEIKSRVAKILSKL